MTTSTTAALECVAQVSAAAKMTSRTGSVSMAPSSSLQARHVLVRGEQAEKLVQGHQHQADADRRSAEVARRRRRATEQDDADQDQRRRDLGDVEGQRLDDQRRADVGAEHHRQRRRQIDEAAGGEAGDHQAGRGAALQDRGHAEAGGESGETVAQRRAERVAQLGAEGALHAGARHMHAPQQQRHAAGEIEERHGEVHRRRLR